MIKRLLRVSLCFLCALTGFGLGRYVWAAPVEDVPVLGASEVKAATGSSRLSMEEAISAVRSGPRRAALILAVAARSDKRELTSLIDASRNDPVTLRFLADTCMKLDPAAFVRAMGASKAMQGPMRLQNTQVLKEMLLRWADTDMDEAWQAANGLTGILRASSLHQLAHKRMETDPKAAIEFALQHPGMAPGYRANKLENGAELLPLIQQLPDCIDKKLLLNAATSDMPLVEAMAAADGSGDANVLARQRILEDAARQDLNVVIEWHRQATGNARYEAARIVGQRMAGKDPVAAVEWARRNLSGPARTEVIQEAAKVLDSRDPAAAAAARVLLPESYSRNHSQK